MQVYKIAGNHRHQVTFFLKGVREVHRSVLWLENIMSECQSTCRVRFLYVLVHLADFLFNTRLSGGLHAAADLRY